MKIVIFGLTISSSWGNGHATLWRGLCRALGRRGHHVVFYERDQPFYAAHRDLHQMEHGRLELFADWAEAEAAARHDLADADVGMVTSYCADGRAASDLLLSSSVPLRVFYDLDTPVTLDALTTGRPIAYIGEGGLGEFDLVLSYTGGRALDDLKIQLGARRVAALYGSVDPDVHRPVPAVPEMQADLSYLGTYAEDRQATLEMLLVEPARRLPHRRFLIGGAQYPERFPWAENIFFLRHVEPGRHAEFFSSSRLTLNVTRRAMKEMGFCPSGRIFEAAACGAPVLSDAWEGLDRFFAPGSEILVAETSEQAIAVMELSDAELHRIARNGRERVLAEHTAEHRVRELEGIFAGAFRHDQTPALYAEEHPGEREEHSLRG